MNKSLRVTDVYPILGIDIDLLRHTVYGYPEIYSPPQVKHSIPGDATRSKARKNRKKKSR